MYIWFPLHRKRERGRTHGNSKISMRKHLEIKWLIALVPHAEHSLQAVFAQRDTVLQTEIIGPSSLHLVAEIGRGEAKVKTDGIVTAFGKRARLGR